MLAKDVMSNGVTSLGFDATVHEAIEMLINTGVSAMPVLDKDDVMIGIVSESDLIRSASPQAWQHPEQGEVDSRPVTDVMTKNVVTADASLPLDEVAKLMATHKVKRLPIVSGKSVVGIVSRIDLVKALLSRRPASTVFAAKPSDAPLSSGEMLHEAVTAAIHGQSWSVVQRGDVVVTGNVAHLWGVVPSTEILEAYRAAAAKVPGIGAVESHMHVLKARPPVPAG